AALRGFAGLEKSPGQIPRARVGRPCAPYEEHPVAALDERHRGRDRIVVERPPALGTATARTAVLTHRPETGAADQAVARRQQRGRRSRPSRIFSAMTVSARAAGAAASVTTKASPRRGPETTRPCSRPGRGSTPSPPGRR